MMKRINTMLAATLVVCAIGVAVGTVSAGPMYRENVVIVPSNTTSVSTPVEYTGMGTGFGEIDRVVAVNASGVGTGTVSFAISDLGGRLLTISTSTNLASGSTWYDWPRYGVIGYGQTNVVGYSARQVTVTVNQPAATNTTRYLFGVFAK